MNITSPLIVRKTIWHHANDPEAPTIHDPGKIGVIVNLMERELRQVDDTLADLFVIADMRHLILGWVFCPDDQPFTGGISINSLTPQQVYGLWRWLAPTKPPGEKVWLPRIEFPQELHGVLARAMRDWQMSQEIADAIIPVRFGDILLSVDEGGDQGGCILRRNQLPEFQQTEMDFHP